MEKNQEKRSGLRVIIVGASISGLTLANALARAGIEFVILEKQKDVEIQKGASIVIFSNGFVTLDQLGLYEKLKDITLPLLANNSRSGREARLIRHFNAFELARKRTGYPVLMLERLGLVKLLYNNLPKKDRVFTSHQVSRVDYSPKGVYVYCNNGASFEGDLVVGADGIHSIVRSEMWRQAAKTDSHAFEMKDKTSMSAEFNIIFGFSRGVKGLVVCQDQRLYGKDFAILVVHAQNDTTYWFLWDKLDKKYNTPNIPRYSQDEAAAVAQKYLDRYVNETVLFKDLWDNRVTYSMHPVEEYLAKRWTWNRFVAIGDAVHKFAPNNGQGGMAAIEDAAALANYIKKINESSSSSLDTTLIEQFLSAFEKLRERRVKCMDEESRLILRGDTVQGWVAYFMTHHLIPNIPDFIENSFTANAVGSVVIDYLPFPEHARTGTMRLNTLLGNGTKDSLLIRAFRALPLLLVLFGFLYAGKTVLEPIRTLLPNYRMYAMSTADWRNSRLFNVNAYSEPQSRLTDSAGELEFLALSYHSIIRHNDSFYTLVLLLFDFHSVYGIMLIEGYRRGTSLTFAQLPILFSSLLKARGCGAISIYSLCYYIQNSPQNFITADQRYVRKNYAQMLLRAITIAYTVPTLYMLFLAPRTSLFIDIISLWQFFPIIVPMVHSLLARLVPDTANQDRLDNPWADLPHLRRFYAATALVSAISYWYVTFMGPSSVAWMIVSEISRLYVTPGSMGDAWGVLLVIDYLAEILAMAILVILQFRDLKAIGRLEVSWTKLVLVYITFIILCGPGAAAVIMWAYREEILKNVPQAPRTRLS